MGACAIEKHFTLARADGGPDADFSLEPAEFSALVRDCKDAWASLGKVNYDLLGSERGVGSHSGEGARGRAAKDDDAHGHGGAQSHAAHRNGHQQRKLAASAKVKQHNPKPG
jgi:hypothetical protein